MKKPDLSKIKIVTKRDWIIFWVFAALVAYGLAGFFQRRIERSLRAVESPWLWQGNAPQSYGQAIAAVVILMLIAEVVCFLRHKQNWIKLTILAVGILAPVALTGMYWLNCKLIVSVLWEESPSYVTVRWRDPAGKSIGYTPTREEQEQLLELSRNLTVVSDEEKQEEFERWWQDSESRSETGSLYLSFPEKYGHHYSLDLHVWGDYLYFFRGYGRGYKRYITLFENNGLIQYMENMEQEQSGAAR